MLLIREARILWGKVGRSAARVAEWLSWAVGLDRLMSGVMARRARDRIQRERWLYQAWRHQK